MQQTAARRWEDKMQGNPFDISFGKSPNETIERVRQNREILEAFTTDPVVQQIFMITGVRGSGKTVLMNTIANSLEAEKEWIVIRLNPDRDLLQSMGAKLCSTRSNAEMFQNAKLNLSLFGFGITVDEAPPITDIEFAIEKMMKTLKKHHKKVLVTIDEVTNNEHVRVFCCVFQILIGQNLPIYLLMTGLYENIESLQDEQSLTFLYRAPKIRMTPLNIGMVAARYAEVFSIPHEEAVRMAVLTKGYSFAFQALGYSRWRNRDSMDRCLAEYRLLLEEYVYEKIWSELSAKDKRIADGIAHCPDGKIASINQYLGLKPDEINQYRRRLIRKGIVSGEEYGRLQFTLPMFEDFVRDLMIE